MPTAPLPDRPNSEQLRTRARELQRGVRGGDPEALALAGVPAADPEYRLSAAQLVLARTHGFASWPRLRAHIAAIEPLTWTCPDAPADESAGDRLLRAACVTFDGDVPADPDAAVALVDAARGPGSPAVAAVCGELTEVSPGTADVPTGPFGWTPLMYLAYSRLDVGADATVRAARLLLEAGADPNAGRYFEGRPTPFTILTGVVGGGESDEPPHPHALALLDVLLAAGADPDDGQALYDLMFDADDTVLERLLDAGLGHGDGGPWRRRLPDLTPSPTDLVRGLLGWAVTHGQRDRVALLAAHGVDLVAPLPGTYGATGTPVTAALAAGQAEVVDLLRSLGAPSAELSGVGAYVAAVLAGDPLDPFAAEVVAAAHVARPGLVVWAAGLGLPAVRAAVAAGFDLDALGRADAPVEQPWQTALHTAVERDDTELVGWLLAHGADPGVRDRRYDATPAQWARHLGRSALEPLLGPGEDPAPAG